MPSLRVIQSFMRPGIAGALAIFAVTATFAVATPAGASDLDWPRRFDSASGTFVIYQPQPEDLYGDVLAGRAAFSLQRSADVDPTFGVLWFTERIAIDRDSSTVTARNMDITKVRLPGITAAETSQFEKLVEAEAARWDLSGSLEDLQAGLAATERERASVADLDNAPPRIIFEPQRAILVVYDGAPILEPIEDTDLEHVANTPYAVVFDPSRHTYYLAGANLWYTAKDPLGPWTSISSPPSAVRAIVPPDTLPDDQVEGIPPKVLTATEPTELIATDGPPQYAPLVGDELLYVTNTESDVVREVSSQALYVLLAGRWYRAPSKEGPWTFVRGDQLPASFRRIPSDSPKGHLLASVAGTDQAEDAIADAEIPQTSAIRRDGSDFEVYYDGPPQFEPIEGTNMEYAVNTDAEVIYADGRYYACDQGVWYIADDPEGPWSVSDTRPLAVDDIPPSCPLYHVRYVYIFDTTPDVIYMGYLPGYMGCYPYYGTVVYGTGYRYRPWRGRHHYYPRFTTWGFHPRYNPWLSRWSFGFSYGTGFLRVGTRWRSWRTAAHLDRRSPWFGPGGFRRPLVSRDLTLLRTRRLAPGRLRSSDRTPMNLYNRSANIGRVDRAALRSPAQAIRISPKPTRLPNNVFAGKDGKVYRRDERGQWKVNEGRAWKPTRAPVAPAQPSQARDRAPVKERAQSPAKPAARPQARPAPAPTPAPAAQPTERPTLRRERPAFKPSPPAISPAPGDLEREYRAREHTGKEASSSETKKPERPEPAREERPKSKSPGQRKPKK